MITPINYHALAAPFPPDEIEWRVGNKSKDGTKATLLCYLTSRAVQQRLDEVVGPDRWSDRYTPIDGGFLCELSIRVGNGSWVTKSDAADKTDIEAIKGGVSGALKRAAVKWGIGRYLYGVDSRYHPIREGYGPDGAIYCPHGDGKGKPGHILVPTLPKWALPPDVLDWAMAQEQRPDPPEGAAGRVDPAPIPAPILTELGELGWDGGSLVQDLRDFAAWSGKGDPIKAIAKVPAWLRGVPQADFDAWQEQHGQLSALLPDVPMEHVDGWCRAKGRPVFAAMDRATREKFIAYLRDAGGLDQVRKHMEAA